MRRSDESQRGVLYVRWRGKGRHWEVVRGAAATILYYSNFPWLAVEAERRRSAARCWQPARLGCASSDRGELQNRSARVVPMKALFPTGNNVGGNLTALAADFSLPGLWLARTPDTAPDPERLVPLQRPRTTNERGKAALTWVATPRRPVGKAPQTDRLGPGGGPGHALGAID